MGYWYSYELLQQDSKTLRLMPFTPRQRGYCIRHGFIECEMWKARRERMNRTRLKYPGGRAVLLYNLLDALYGRLGDHPFRYRKKCHFRIHLHVLPTVDMSPERSSPEKVTPPQSHLRRNLSQNGSVALSNGCVDSPMLGSPDRSRGPRPTTHAQLPFIARLVFFQMTHFGIACILRSPLVPTEAWVRAASG